MPRNATPQVYKHRLAGYTYWSRRTYSDSPRLAPVVLIGGALHRKEDWGRVEQGLLEHADVICPDLPGWGGADLLPPYLGTDIPAEAMVRLLDDLRIERVNLFAGSYGSSVGYRLAQTHPDRIGRMVLAGTMGGIPLASRPMMRAAVALAERGPREQFGPAAVDVLMSPHPDIAAKSVVRRILAMRFGAADDADLAKFIANTNRLLSRDLIDPSVPPAVPTLFTTGEHDTLTPPELCRELAFTCPESWYVELARADHLIHLERPAQLVDLMVRFFDREPLDDLPYATVVEDLRRVPATV
ncbi:alpha/beta fold hydrolase [Glycomyces niveus]|uniref:Alpha/beta fold hydrolase n=1 Tax=Glycomyces niveus TaxID=2820287 RepID=A0ABS3U4K7_9ACTN|nr:alpha/beta hydrolase [Glycomyces sp. NEAU-S30]MBO3733703.1 alpha/beta fold hydrolase [Glycomyces sp. NEAU-S30]